MLFSDFPYFFLSKRKYCLKYSIYCRVLDICKFVPDLFISLYANTIRVIEVNRTREK